MVLSSWFLSTWPFVAVRSFALPFHADDADVRVSTAKQHQRTFTWFICLHLLLRYSVRIFLHFQHSFCSVYCSNVFHRFASHVHRFWLECYCQIIAANWNKTRLCTYQTNQSMQGSMNRSSVGRCFCCGNPFHCYCCSYLRDLKCYAIENLLAQALNWICVLNSVLLRLKIG